ncbi:MAG: hypothetical protein NWF06_05200 [Candidatus Bathyarchaeota archaeon]|nr:hypothetical protein [Candidatus Bathyarchaeum sp.]
MLDIVQRKLGQNTIKVIELALNNSIGLRAASINPAKERTIKINKKY